MAIQYAGALLGGLGTMSSPQAPGSLSINTNNQGFPNPYTPKPGGAVNA